MRKLLSWLLVILLLSVTVPAWAENAPFLFEGVPWGSSVDDVLNSAKFKNLKASDFGAGVGERINGAEYFTVSYPGQEAYGEELFIVFGFGADSTLCYGLYQPLLFDEEALENAYAKFLKGISQNYGEPLIQEDKEAVWEVGATRIVVSLGATVCVYFADTKICPFLTSEELIAYNDTTTGKYGMVENKPQVEKLAEIESVKMGKDAIGTPQVFVRIENVSQEKTIDAFDFECKCYNTYGEVIKGYGIYDVFSGTYQEGKIKPGKLSKKDWRWTLYGYDNTTDVEVALIRVHTTDGDTIDIAPVEQVWVKP